MRNKLAQAIVGVSLLVGISFFMNMNDACTAARNYLATAPEIASRYGKIQWAVATNMRSISSTESAASYKTYRYWAKTDKGLKNITIKIDGWPQSPHFTEVPF